MLTNEILKDAIKEMDRAQYFSVAYASTSSSLCKVPVIQQVNSDLNGFRSRALAELVNWPFIEQFFGDMLRHRLSQDDPLASRFMTSRKKGAEHLHGGSKVPDLTLFRVHLPLNPIQIAVI